MIYLKVPAVIFRAIRQALALYGEEENIRWLQMDFIENMVKSHVIYKDGKLMMKNDEATGLDFDILKSIIHDLHGKTS